MTTSEILNLLLGGGLVAFVAALAKVFKDWREGTWRRQDSAVADLERWRAAADDSREWAELQHQWWRNWAGRLEYVILVRLGSSELPQRDPYPDKPNTIKEQEGRS